MEPTLGPNLWSERLHCLPTLSKILQELLLLFFCKLQSHVPKVLRARGTWTRAVTREVAGFTTVVAGLPPSGSTHVHWLSRSSKGDSCRVTLVSGGSSKLGSPHDRVSRKGLGGGLGLRTLWDEGGGRANSSTWNRGNSTSVTAFYQLACFLYRGHEGLEVAGLVHAEAILHSMGFMFILRTSMTWSASGVSEVIVLG